MNEEYIRLCNLPNGCSLYMKENEVGGRIYYSDEVGDGLFVWDTSLVDMGTLMAAITEELTIQRNNMVNLILKNIKI